MTQTRKPRTNLPEPFSFEDAGRSFACSSEPLRQSGDEMWWWFRVSTDSQSRYASFRAEPGDTQSSVQARIVAFWDDLLVRRAAPPVNRWQRGRPPAVKEASVVVDEPSPTA